MQDAKTTRTQRALFALGGLLLAASSGWLYGYSRPGAGGNPLAALVALVPLTVGIELLLARVGGPLGAALAIVAGTIMGFLGGGPATAWVAAAAPALAALDEYPWLVTAPHAAIYALTAWLCWWATRRGHRTTFALVAAVVFAEGIIPTVGHDALGLAFYETPGLVALVALGGSLLATAVVALVNAAGAELVVAAARRGGLQLGLLIAAAVSIGGSFGLDAIRGMALSGAVEDAPTMDLLLVQPGPGDAEDDAHASLIAQTEAAMGEPGSLSLILWPDAPPADTEPPGRRSPLTDVPLMWTRTTQGSTADASAPTVTRRLTAYPAGWSTTESEPVAPLEVTQRGQWRFPRVLERLPLRAARVARAMPRVASGAAEASPPDVSGAPTTAANDNDNDGDNDDDDARASGESADANDGATTNESGGAGDAAAPTLPLITLNEVPTAVVLGDEILYDDALLATIGSAEPEWIVASADDRMLDAQGRAHHHAQAVFRALEHGRYLVRITRAGLSSVIDPTGRTEAALPSGVPATARASVPRLRAQTAYRVAGPWPLYLAAFASLLMLVFRNRRGKPDEDEDGDEDAGVAP